MVAVSSRTGSGVGCARFVAVSYQAETVETMNAAAELLATLSLGDVVTLPDGRPLTIRACVPLEAPVRSMGGFALAGELSALLSVAPTPGSPVLVYLPGRLHPGARTRAEREGAARYWAPHLPGTTGAMGELLWRVVTVEGHVDPAVIVFRGSEVIPFLRTGEAHPGDLHIMRLRRDAGVDVDVDRTAAVVVPYGSPVPASDLYQTVVGDRARRR
jgi:hypothetical protein